MNGLELSRQYYETHGRPMIQRLFPQEANVIAAGMVGEGSECLGFDDHISEDHDFGPGFCLWLRQSDYAVIGSDLQTAYDGLPRAFQGYHGRQESLHADQRVGVFSIEGFFSKYTNTAHYPVDALQWFKIPMSYLRTATNGAVFSDPLGVFSEIREVLLQFYPTDVIRKKLAAKLAVMAQAGQYNYTRSMQRGDAGAAYLSAAEFVKATLAVVYLLNRIYMPFYKWAFRGTETLPHGQSCVADLKRFCALPDTAVYGTEKVELIEKIAVSVVDELRRQGYTHHREPFLQAQASSIAEAITDVRLRSLPLTLDFD